jgi:hypothetical protein
MTAIYVPVHGWGDTRAFVTCFNCSKAFLGQLGWWQIHPCGIWSRYIQQDAELAFEYIDPTLSYVCIMIDSNDGKVSHLIANKESWLYMWTGLMESTVRIEKCLLPHCRIWRHESMMRTCRCSRIYCIVMWMFMIGIESMENLRNSFHV